MPGFTCCVPGCYNNSHRDRELRFYTFPKDPAQREVWLKNISRAGVSGCFSTFQPTTGHRVCSVHFPGGRKTYTIRVPTLFPLRGVNERKSRRGRNKKLFAAVPGVVSGAVPGSGPIITSVVSIAAEGEGNGETTVVQIGQNGQYITPPVDLTAAGGGDRVEDCAGDSAGGGDSAGAGAGYINAAAAAAAGVLIAGQCGGVGLSGEDHCYSLTNGTTSAELLRKLNEQRDIIALMEVKMKEMRNTIRELRVTEAQLQEELRERDRLLSATSSTMSTSTSPSARKKV